MSDVREVRFADSYRAVKRQQYRFNARYYVREATLSGLAWANLLAGRIHEALRRPRVQVLLLHHLFEDESQRFRMLLRALSVNHTFISYSEAINRALSGDIDRPYLTFSVDDGFKNNLCLAETLREFGAKACFFLCPTIIGESNPSQIWRFGTERLHFPPIEFLNWGDVESLQKQGHEIGSHTLSHSDLAQCGSEQMHDEITRSRDLLLEHCDQIKHFAWPYGRFSQFSGAARKMVFDAGYESCASGERGCHCALPGGFDRTQLCVRRDHVVAGWDPKHVLYFLARNAWRSSPSNNGFPY
jgi:peptidoglycan/xylan/chitin deacetylase (PgdA/CDA1 family)